MKRTFKALAVVLVGSGLVAFAAAPAASGEEFCAMGGLQIKAEVVKEKALDWANDRKKATVVDASSDTWSALTLAKSDDDIAILVSAGSVFFGVAGEGGREVDARVAEKVFGRDLRKLSEAVKKEMTELWKAGAVKIQGADIQQLINAVALGTLEKDRDWKLTTADCKGLDLDASSLK